MGMATTMTREMTYESFFWSPLMVPQVAMAADTPQILTELASMVDISSSTLKTLRATQKPKYHTQSTTIRACARPYAPDFSTS